MAEINSVSESVIFGSPVVNRGDFNAPKTVCGNLRNRSYLFVCEVQARNDGESGWKIKWQYKSRSDIRELD
jgi:hypothetical protein